MTWPLNFYRQTTPAIANICTFCIRVTRPSNQYWTCPQTIKQCWLIKQNILVDSLSFWAANINSEHTVHWSGQTLPLLYQGIDSPIIQRTDIQDILLCKTHWKDWGITGLLGLSCKYTTSGQKFPFWHTENSIYSPAPLHKNWKILNYRIHIIFPLNLLTQVANSYNSIID